jgi:hypothetical protein
MKVTISHLNDPLWIEADFEVAYLLFELGFEVQA